MDHYGQPNMNSVTSSMNHLSMDGRTQSNNLGNYPHTVHYPSMPVPSHEELFPEFIKGNNTLSGSSSSTPVVAHVQPSTSIVPQQPQQASVDMEVLNQLRNGMTRIMATMERLEHRISRVEQATSQILKNQQESFQVPFMSQKEIENAKLLAEQHEQRERDANVAKQLQAAYNKEIEVKKQGGHPMMMAECPVCGSRVAQGNLEQHVEDCLDQFSNDPKKEVAIQETKEKMESGFFSKFFNKKTETTTTKVVSRTTSQSTPLLQESSDGNQMYPGYAYPPFMNPQFGNSQNMQGMPMMMPMYMYPGYPGMQQQQNE